MNFLVLFIAILGEVFANTMLKLSEGFKKKLPIIGLALGYIVSFSGLTLSLTTIPLSIAYAIWSGLGTALTTVVGVLIFRESLNRKKSLGVLLIIFGVICLNLSE